LFCFVSWFLGLLFLLFQSSIFIKKNSKKKKESEHTPLRKISNASCFPFRFPHFGFNNCLIFPPCSLYIFI
jgi:hypothetical protein